ncbi:hypothetical protein P7H19_21755 [Paenibacillus larvae]|nr:hypothetical protein [Paenibacillus larvae]MDT2238379.1 hypothetical protein [Paenibacillus larvae]
MYFTFYQSNPGGFTIVNDSVCDVVIIETDTADQANKKPRKLVFILMGVLLGMTALVVETGGMHNTVTTKEQKNRNYTGYPCTRLRVVFSVVRRTSII